jgi:hypothetical protein
LLGQFARAAGRLPLVDDLASTQQRQSYEGHPLTPGQQLGASSTAVRTDTRDLKAFASWLEPEDSPREKVLSRVRIPNAAKVPIAPVTQEGLDRIVGVTDLTDAVDLRDPVV